MFHLPSKENTADVLRLWIGERHCNLRSFVKFTNTNVTVSVKSQIVLFLGKNGDYVLRPWSKSCCVPVHKLRKLIARKDQLPIENLRLILQGDVLHDSKNGEDLCVQLNDGDSLIVAVKPKPPAKHIRGGLDDDDDDDDEDDLKFKLPQSTNWCKRKLFCFLHDKLKLPDILLMAIFSLSLKGWAVVIMWFILAPVAHRWDIGPLYILATGFLIIFRNLGQRQHGDVSAYSIFNDDFRELPGTLNADRVDRDIRAGQF